MAIVLEAAAPDPVNAAVAALVEAALDSPREYTAEGLKEMVGEAILSEGVLDRVKGVVHRAAAGAGGERAHTAHFRATYSTDDPKFNRERAEEFAKSAHEDATNKGFSHSSGTVKINSQGWHHSHGELHHAVGESGVAPNGT